jgi:hypothetical protein
MNDRVIVVEDDMTISPMYGIALSGVLLIGTTQLAQAAYPCGEGFTLQDGYCKPYRGPYTHPYRVAPYGYYSYGAAPYGFAYQFRIPRHHHRHRHHRHYY